MRSMRPWIAGTVFLSLLPPLVCADASHLRLFHRVYHPIAPQTPFSERGTLILSDSSSVSFQPSHTFSQDLIQFSEGLKSLESGTEGALYQVALERDGDLVQGHWDISSVKVCHVRQGVSEHIILHTIDPHSVKPYALDYFVSPIPHDGSCPRLKSTSKMPDSELGAYLFHSFADSFEGLNMTLSVKASRFPPLPELRSPPPLSAEGELIKPMPEKTFFQKYWMYIAIVFAALMLSSSPEEEQPKRRD